MNASATDTMLRSFGATGGAAPDLDLLVAQQRRRRRLVLRAVLDAAAEAPPDVLPPSAAARVLGDWRLLTAAEAADPAAAHQVVDYPMTGAWAERTLRALTVPGSATPAALARHLGHLRALAAAAAARAGLPFTADVPVSGGRLVLPTLGSCQLGPVRATSPGAGGNAPPPPAPTAVRVTGDGTRLWLYVPRAPFAAGALSAPHAVRTALPYPAGTLTGPPDTAAGHDAPHPGARPAAGGPVEVRRGSDGIWRSAAAAWRPIRALWGTDGHPVLIEDVDTYRDEEGGGNPYGMSVVDGAAGVDAAQHARWRAAWHDARPWLRLGGGGRAVEADVLLQCLVPLVGSPTAHYSATRGEAFGALLSTTPRTGLELAVTVVHELQHTKLLALTGLTALHTADDTPRYWAPWRPDPRPFNGLFQGAYAHLALADFHQRVALSAASPAVRDTAWADHCRCRLQVEAALPQMLACSRLTAHGRTLVTAMAAHHTRLKEHPPPDGHLARATAYVETSRVMWRRQGVKGV